MDWTFIPYRVREAFDFPWHLRRLRWFFQRGRRGWSSWDASDGGHYIARVAREVVTEYKRNNGPPSGGYPANLMCEEAIKTDGTCSHDHGAEWNAILDEIILGLDSAEHLSWDCECFNPPRHPASEDELVDFRAAMKLHDDEHQQRWDRAFDLLKKWMLGIWI